MRSFARLSLAVSLVFVMFAGVHALVPSADAYPTVPVAASKIIGVVPVANGGTGSATKNFVDLTTAQTVAGTKAFSSPLTDPAPSGVGASAAGVSVTPHAGVAGVVAAPATGSMQFALPAAYTNNQTDTLSDQDGVFRAEYKRVALGFVATGAPWVVVDITASVTAEDVLQAFLGVATGITHLAPTTPGDGLITFVNNTSSTAGNIPITGTSPTTRLGMSGGADAVTGGSGGDVTLSPGAAGAAGGSAGKVHVTRALLVDGAATATGGFVGNLTGTASLATLATSATTATTTTGNAGTVTNGLYSTGSYADPVWLTSLAGGKISSAVANATVAATCTVVGINGVSAASLDPAALRYLGGIGLVAAGAVTLTGAVVGNKVVGVLSPGVTQTSCFETTITVMNQIQQTGCTIAGATLSVLLVAKGG